MTTSKTFALMGWAFAAFFAVYAGLSVLIIKGESDAAKALPHTLLCFDKGGRPTIADNWARCDDVQYRVTSRAF